MKFTRYTSLTNHYQVKFLETVLMEGKSDGLWVGTEKAHGANFSFYYDGTRLRTAKRSGFNGDDEHFYGSQELIASYGEHIKTMYHQLWITGIIDDEDILIVRGEVIGGNYAGVKTHNAKLVQKQVQYCPNNEFIAFDIQINDEYLS